jgi:pimeloyl-ACP methyl ester carboxylesterase
MHGYPDDHWIYNRLRAHLSPRRTVAFDFLGYGRSERADISNFSPEDRRAEITAVLDELDIPRAVLVGHDASGPDAVLYAVNSPQRVAHLVLLNTIFGHQPSLRMPEMTRLFADSELVTLADDMTGDPGQLLWLLQRWGDQWGLDSDDPDGIVKNSILPQFLGEEDQPDALASIRAWTATLHKDLSYQDEVIQSGALRDLPVPVSIIFGERDPYLSPSLAAELSDLFTDPSFQLLAGAGHWVQHDQPDVVAELLRGF